MIDTTGTALHKRGYRPETVTAPLRETLAAAMVKLARPREGVLLWDPFCGSGTIAIEAALMMTNTAPGLNRPFTAEVFPQIPKEWWEEARDRALDEIIEPDFEVYASDIDPECVRVATASVKRAGVSKYVKVFQKDALTISTEGRRGTIVCNPPYGERLMSASEVESLYRKMGKHFASLDRWQIYVITSHEEFERLYGRKADKIRRLYNGMIKCNYYQFFKSPNKERN
jgi:putative N6-adenine-specific DNA methylase